MVCERESRHLAESGSVRVHEGSRTGDSAARHYREHGRAGVHRNGNGGGDSGGGARKVIEKIPQRRLGKPEEVARVARATSPAPSSTSTASWIYNAPLAIGASYAMAYKDTARGFNPLARRACSRLPVMIEDAKYVPAVECRLPKRSTSSRDSIMRSRAIAVS